MAKRPLATRRYWPRTMGKLERKAQARAMDMAELICQQIALSPVTPRLTGRLSKSYYAERTPDGDAVVKTNIRYWMFVEYGTGNHQAQPHVAPAVEYVKAVFD